MAESHCKFRDSAILSYWPTGHEARFHGGRENKNVRSGQQPTRPTACGRQRGVKDDTNASHTSIKFRAVQLILEQEENLTAQRVV